MVRCGAYLLMMFFFSANAWSQPQWSVPIQITHGSGDDLHPAIANSSAWASPFTFSQEWLAFSGKGGNICLMKTTSDNTQWADTVFQVTKDSADNDYPSLMRGFLNDNHFMLVWQSGQHGNLDVYHSHNIGTGWSIPQPVTADPADDMFPMVAANDSGFGATWEREGRIIFSEFSTSGWSSPEFVSPPLDYGNASPDIVYFAIYPDLYPLVIWEKEKPSDSTRAIMYSLKTGAGWSAPDTLAWTGDNRNARFFKMGSLGVNWESNRTRIWQIYSTLAEYGSGTLSWRDASPVSQTSEDERNASINGFGIITDGGSPPFIAGTWESHAVMDDSITAATDRGYFVDRLAAAPFSVDRNPDISIGVFVSNGIRLWTVWENNSSGYWKLYGSNVFIQLDDVDEGYALPRGLLLTQNYPNPFNPSTRIHYELPQKAFVTLKVYNILGQEVATLVNEEKLAGSYHVEFAGTSLASGVYFYRLRAGEFVDTKKLLLLR